MVVAGLVLGSIAAFAYFFLDDLVREWILYGMGAGLVTGGGACLVSRMYDDDEWGNAALLITMVSGIVGGPIVSGLVGTYLFVVAFNRGAS